MRFHGLEIDLNAIAAIITAFAALYTAMRGNNLVKKRKEEKNANNQAKNP